MTYDETKAAAHLMLEWAQARQNGFPFTLEVRSRGCNEWTAPEWPSWNWSCCDFRRKPEPKVVPLEMKDIDLHRDLFRATGGRSAVSTAYAMNAGGIWLANDETHYTWTHLMEAIEVNRSDGKGWGPCSKEVA